jgi:argininosuccinate lyase
MPGYTHTRQAMPSTLGQRFGAAAEGLTADLEALEPALHASSRGALGSASGYGVPLPLDRRMTARLLGQDDLDVNTLHVQDTRGRLEARALFGLHQVTLTLARLATDLTWWSSEAFGFVSLPAELTTGSSIMPNKRNPDVLELVRALPASMLARYVEVTALLQGLGAGYHRDLQRTKGPLMRGIEEARAALAVMALAVQRLVVHKEACELALTAGVYATDAAYEQVRAGVPFRDAYRRVKEAGAGERDPQTVLAARTHEGAPGTDHVPALRRRLAEATARLVPFAAGARTARSLLSRDTGSRMPSR